jgi:hypothetical protein
MYCFHANSVNLVRLSPCTGCDAYWFIPLCSVPGYSAITAHLVVLEFLLELDDPLRLGAYGGLSRNWNHISKWIHGDNQQELKREGTDSKWTIDTLFAHQIDQKVTTRSTLSSWDDVEHLHDAKPHDHIRSNDMELTPVYWSFDPRSLEHMENS